jgi:hypothetical protein
MLVRGALVAKLRKTESTSTVFHARLVEQARPEDPVWAEAVRQATALMLRTGSGPATAKQQALAVLNGVIGTDGGGRPSLGQRHRNQRLSGR